MKYYPIWKKGVKLKMELSWRWDHSQLSRWALNPMTSILKGERHWQKRRHRYTEDRAMWRNRQKLRVMWLQPKKCQGMLTVIVLGARTMRELICVVKLPKIRVICYSIPKKQLPSSFWKLSLWFLSICETSHIFFSILSYKFSEFI